jgi:hypothetical protein
MTASVDDLAVDLLEGVHRYMAAQLRLVGSWPSEEERLIWVQLDVALALFLAHLEGLDEPGAEAVN